MIISIFKVHDLKTNISYRYEVTGTGQESVSYLRKKIPFFSRIVLEGFKINGKFVPLRYDR